MRSHLSRQSPGFNTGRFSSFDATDSIRRIASVVIDPVHWDSIASGLLTAIRRMAGCAASFRKRFGPKVEVTRQHAYYWRRADA
jgi:hypothetical protein